MSLRRARHELADIVQPAVSTNLAMKGVALELRADPDPTKQLAGEILDRVLDLALLIRRQPDYDGDVRDYFLTEVRVRR